MRGRAAIISNDEMLISLSKNELLLLDFEVDVFADTKVLLDGYDAVILDGNTSSVFPACDSKIKLSVRGNVAGASASFEFPFLLSDLRNAICGHKEPHEANEDKAKKQANVIFADKKSLTVRIFGVTVKLTQSELLILETLCSSHGEYVTLSDLNSLLGASNGNIAAVYICHLRRKLESASGVKVILTARCKGYMTKFLMK